MQDEESLRLTAAHRIALSHPEEPLSPAVLILVDMVHRLRAAILSAVPAARPATIARAEDTSHGGETEGRQGR